MSRQWYTVTLLIPINYPIDLTTTSRTYYFNVNTSDVIMGFYNMDGVNLLQSKVGYSYGDNEFNTVSNLFNNNQGVLFKDITIADDVPATATGTDIFRLYNGETIPYILGFMENNSRTGQMSGCTITITANTTSPISSISTELQRLINEFNAQLEVTMDSYPSSKINDDGVYEDNLEKLYTILAKIDSYQTELGSDIAMNDSALQGMLSSLSDTQATNAANDDAYDTIHRSLEDVKSTYDKNVILLSIKVCIVLLIFMKGNDIYIRNSSLFLILIFLFTVFYGTSYIYK